MTGPGTLDALRAIKDPEQQAQAVKKYIHDRGTLDCLSSAKVTAKPKGALTMLVHDGQPTSEGESLSTRVAVVLARRSA